MKPVILTYHAAVERMLEHGLTRTTVERIAREPQWREPDPRPEVERRFGSAPELGGRVVRVAVVEDAAHIRVLSAFPDRRASPPR